MKQAQKMENQFMNYLKILIKKLYIKYIESNFSDTYSTKSVSTTRSLMNPCGSESEKCKVCDCNIF